MLKPEPETVLDAESVVKEPAAADVPPIAGGEANKVVKPVPETVLEAESVVKDPAPADVPPIAGGEANKVVNPAPETVLDAASVVNDLPPEGRNIAEQIKLWKNVFSCFVRKVNVYVFCSFPAFGRRQGTQI